MTILYKPVLIESAEQAEALPLGTIATSEALGESAVLVQFQGGVFWRSGALQVEDSYLVGWKALVPIEAEEETLTHFCTPGCREGDYCTGPMSRNTRYVTPWEEA